MIFLASKILSSPSSKNCSSQSLKQSSTKAPKIINFTTVSWSWNDPGFLRKSLELVAFFCNGQIVTKNLEHLLSHFWLSECSIYHKGNFLVPGYYGQGSKGNFWKIEQQLWGKSRHQLDISFKGKILHSFVLPMSARIAFTSRFSNVPFMTLRKTALKRDLLSVYSYGGQQYDIHFCIQNGQNIRVAYPFLGVSWGVSWDFSSWVSSLPS